MAKRETSETENLCQCGCGLPAGTYQWATRRLGIKKGAPRRFIPGHNGRANGARSLEERIVANVDFTKGECWIWCGKRDRTGYGQVRRPNEQQLRPAHREVYETLVGPVPAGLELDHLCSTRACVNPGHLEPVTHAENLRRAHAT